MNSAQLVNCCLTSKTWNVLASNENLWNGVVLREKAFGKKQWETYFGDIGIEPPLPTDIRNILKSPCPFFPGKKVRESHILVLIPETVNGKRLNLTLLGELVKAPKDGKATQYRYIWDEIINDQGINQATPKSHWALMTKDVIPGSRNKSYPDQKKMIADVVEKTEINYEVPNAIDALICIFMHHISSGERLFNDNPYTGTRCQESIQGYPIYVGGFSPAGLFVSIYDIDDDSIGVAALRKFL